MRKIVSIILILMMALSMVPTVSADSIAESTTYVPNPMELPLSLSVGARVTGSTGAFTYPKSGSLSVTVGEAEKRAVDYRARLDMSTIRALFDEGFIKAVLPHNADADAEFKNGTVSTTINVAIEYPSTAIVGKKVNLSSKTVGTLDAGSIFSETAREVKGNSVKISYKNKNGLKVSELSRNVDTYLKDIEFTLNGAISYSEAGSHIVKVILSGETVIKFSSKEQVVKYSNEASNVVVVTKDSSIHNHELVVVPAVSATCLATGATEGIICRTHNSYGDCGALGTKEPGTIPALNHMLNGESLKIHVDAEPATCTAKGLLAHWTCALCKNDFASQDSDVIVSHENYVIPTIPHTNVELPAVVPGCTTNGFTAGTKCSVCNRITKAQTVIAPLGHTRAPLAAVAATCTTAGKSAGVECSVCHTIIEPQADIPALGHKYGEWRVVTAATESATGLMERFCLNECGERETKIIEKKPHTCVKDDSLAAVVKEATCTEKGSLQNYCKCGKKVGDPVDIPMKAHNVTHVAATPATCVAEGVVEHYLCGMCGGKFRDAAATKAIASVKESINKTNHGEGNITVVKGLAPTCSKHGLTDGAKCKNCGIVTVHQELIPLAPHTLIDITETPATCEQHGIKAHKHCKHCNKDFDMSGTVEWTALDFDIPAIGHKYSDPVKEPAEQEPVDGHWTGVKRCIHDGCDSHIDVLIAVTPENCPHRITFEVIEHEPSCTEKGEKVIVCFACGEATEYEMPKTAHTLTRIESVPSTCHTKGTAAYYKCSKCGHLFDGVDSTKEISEPAKLGLTTHVFRVIGNGNNQQCIYCHEVVHLKKTDKNGNEDTTDNITVNNVSVGIKAEEDIKKEEAYKEIDIEVTIESEILVTEKEEVSAKVDESITEAIADKSEDIVVNKAIWDIEIEKVTTHKDSEEVIVDVERESIKEISDIIEIVIKIPEHLADSVDFLVHRLHRDADGVEHVDVITTTRNNEGEYIKINKRAGTVTLFVKKFSEYALVGYSEKVNEEGTNRPASTGGGSSNYVITFKTDGGTVVDSIKVAPGKIVEEPVTTKEGYIFGGWYTDAKFTEKFDFTNPIKRSVTLYAKWIEDTTSGECAGTVEANCPAVKFSDVDTSLWYHAGIDYVLDEGLMIGISDELFAPDANITRAMLVTVLGRREGVAADAAAGETFTDVKADTYYAAYVDWAAENNIVNGYGNGEFGPDDHLTREQMAAIMYRYITFKAYELEGEITEATFADADSIQGYAKEAVNFCFSKGIMTGKDNNMFDPTGNATRAEIATVLMRLFK